MALATYLTEVDGVFYRAIDPAYRQFALSGSRNPGRYSDSSQPTLYLSSSPEGVAAAMVAHKDSRSADLELIKIRVNAENILDLRDSAAVQAAGIDLQDALAPWQEIVAQGGVPASWTLRRQLESQGVVGLIDPSRKAPGLWHLVLFSWNQGDHPNVSLLD